MSIVPCCHLLSPSRLSLIILPCPLIYSASILYYLVFIPSLLLSISLFQKFIDRSPSFPRNSLPNLVDPHSFFFVLLNSNFSGMGKITSTQHHCPMRSKGNCRKAKSAGGVPYCSKHQEVCYCNGDHKHLITEGCGSCHGNMT